MFSYGKSIPACFDKIAKSNIGRTPISLLPGETDNRALTMSRLAVILTAKRDIGYFSP